MNFIFFSTELILLLLLFKYYKFSFISFSYLIFFIYAQSLYLDYILFNKNEFYSSYSSLLSININSIEFYYVGLSYFLFMLTLALPLILLKIKKTNKNLIFYNKYKFLLNILIFILITYLIYYIYRIYGIERYIIKKITGNVFDSLLFSIAVYFWIFLIFNTNLRTFIFYLYTLVVSVAMLLVFEREYLVILGLIVFDLYFNKVSLLKFFTLFIVSIFILSYSKAIGTAILFANNFEEFINIIQNNDFLFSKMDSLISFLMIGDYFKHGGEFYNSYYLTYITHSIAQILKVIFRFDFPTLAQQSTLYYTNGKMGTAFSLILESLINFWIFGPVIAGLLLFIFYKYVYDKMITIYKNSFNILMIIISLKLIRTEFAIVLKLYVLPIILALILFRIFFKKKIKNENQFY